MRYNNFNVLVNVFPGLVKSGQIPSLTSHRPLTIKLRIPHVILVSFIYRLENLPDVTTHNQFKLVKG